LIDWLAGLWELVGPGLRFSNTADATTVYDALEKGLDDLMSLCDVVADKFTQARDAFAQAQTG
jgi:hypothetical protein